MFKVLKTDGVARRGEFHTPHGVIQSPFFMNVGVKPFHDILMAENIVFLEVLKNLEKLEQDVFFMSYAPLPILGLDSCPIRAYAIEGLADFSN